MVLGAVHAFKAKDAAVAKQVETGYFRFLRFVALLYRDVRAAVAVFWRYPSAGDILSFACLFAFDLVRNESVHNRSRHGLETRDHWVLGKLCYGDFECLCSACWIAEGQPTQL